MSEANAGGDGDGPRWQRFLQRFVGNTASERLAISLAALVLSIALGAVIVFASGVAAYLLGNCDEVAFAVTPAARSCYNPVETYDALFLEPFSGKESIGLTLKDTSLLLFTGLSVAVAFRAGLFNIGTQGQLIAGAMSTAVGVVALAEFVPGGTAGTLVLIPVGLALGAIAGGLYGAIPGALKAYGDANEVITTIMLNFIAIRVSFYLGSNFFKDPGTQIVRTRPVPEYAMFPRVPAIGFSERTPFSLYVLVMGLLLVAGIWYLLRQTSYGYDLRTSGEQPEAAEYGGVDAKRTTVTSMALSGAIGGVGGAVWVLMVTSYWINGVPSLGFDGITVSILAGNNPVGVGAAALLFGTLKAGSLGIEFSTGVPQQLVGVLRGLIILFVAMPEFFRLLGGRFLPEERQAAVAADGGGGDE